MTSLLIIGLIYYWAIKVSDRKYQHINKTKHRYIVWGIVIAIILLSPNFGFLLIPLPLVVIAKWYLDKKKDEKEACEEKMKNEMEAHVYEEQRKREAYENRRNELTAQFIKAKNCYLRLFYDADRSILNFFHSTLKSSLRMAPIKPEDGLLSLQEDSRSLGDLVSALEQNVSDMQQAKKDMIVTKESLEKEYNQIVSEKLLYNNDARSVESIKQLSCDLKAFELKCQDTISTSKMIDEAKYGQPNHEFLASIRCLRHEDAVGFIDYCSKLLWQNTIAPLYEPCKLSDTGELTLPSAGADFNEETAAYEREKRINQIQEIFSLDLERVIKCIWFFALETPFSIQDYQNAKRVFYHIFRKKYFNDIIVADLYSRFKLGGEEAIREDIKQLLEKHPHDNSLLIMVASSLMWMKAYHSENAILQHILSNGLEMNVAAQQRLHTLTNSGGKTANCLDVPINTDVMYFDVSALVWKDDDYTRLFDTLAFQGKSLSYSLAIRDEDKDLLIPNGIVVPNTEQIHAKIEAAFADEYGEGVTCSIVNSIAVSGSGEEKMKSILVSSADCPHMGILIHLTKIGKKLTIKLYTLFIPVNKELIEQKQQSLSLHNKLSPSTNSWESSLKETLLVATQQLLNNAVQYSNGDNGSSEGSGPIF